MEEAAIKIEYLEKIKKDQRENEKVLKRTLGAKQEAVDKM